MVKRIAISSVLAMLVVGGVLLLMQSLITTARSRLVTSTDRHFVNFVRVTRDESVQRRERKRDRPPEPKSPPPSALQPRLDALAPVVIDLPVSAPNTAMDLDLGGFGIGAGDGNYLPIVKIEPAYPMAALQRQIEGYCIVEYTVTTTGSVRDVQVIEADPPDIFNRASVEAARKFKYKPRIVNGEAIEVVGVRNIFRYKLERR